MKKALCLFWITALWLSIVFLSGCGSRKVAVNRSSSETQSEVKVLKQITETKKDSTAVNKTERDSSASTSSVKSVTIKSDSNTVTATGDNLEISDGGKTIKGAKTYSNTNTAKSNQQIDELKSQLAVKQRTNDSLRVSDSRKDEIIDSLRKDVKNERNSNRNVDKKSPIESVPWYAWVVGAGVLAFGALRFFK